MIDKYRKALKDHAFKLTDEAVTEKVSKIINEKAEENNTVEVLRKI